MHPSLMKTDRTSIARLERQAYTGERAHRSFLDGDEQNHVEVLTGKRLQQVEFDPENPPDVIPGAPVLSALTPDSAVIGSPSFTLKVTGTGFKSTAVIVFNDIDEPTTFVSATEVTTGVNMDVWQGPSLPLPVAVRNADGPISNELMFTFTAEGAGVLSGKRGATTPDRPEAHPKAEHEVAHKEPGKR